jgi:mercuric reductase
MPDIEKYDLIIIGGGSAAFSSAFKAEEHNTKTAMVERGMLGGTCVNVGCVPSKNLLRAGELLYSSVNPSFPSIFPCESNKDNNSNNNFDFSKTIRGKDNLVSFLRKQKYYDVLLSLENVELIKGSASFLNEHRIKVNGDKKEVLEADKFIIATGSYATVPSKIKGIDKVDYITNIEALSLDKKPCSMIVVGGRALGLEFAQMYSRFGTKVTVLQRSDTIIPEHEPEVSSALGQYLSEEGIDIITGVMIEEVYQRNDTKFVGISQGKDNNKTKTLEAEELLMATGRRPNTKDLHLENAGVRLRQNDGAIIVDLEMHTSAPNIWAAGDVVGEPMLETLAAKEGAIAADNALTNSHKKVDFLSVPSAIFTSPQVASVGLTEKQAIERYGVCSCRILGMNEVPKALIINDTKGLIKMVVNPNKNNRIVGVHILADIAADMIHEAAIAIKYGLTIDDIVDTVHVFPTMTESIKLVATAFKQDVKKLSCCAE